MSCIDELPKLYAKIKAGKATAEDMALYKVYVSMSCMREDALTSWIKDQARAYQSEYPQEDES